MRFGGLSLFKVLKKVANGLSAEEMKRNVRQGIDWSWNVHMSPTMQGQKYQNFSCLHAFWPNVSVLHAQGRLSKSAHKRACPLVFVSLYGMHRAAPERFAVTMFASLQKQGGARIQYGIWETFGTGKMMHAHERPIWVLSLCNNVLIGNVENVQNDGRGLRQ